MTKSPDLEMVGESIEADEFTQSIRKIFNDGFKHPYADFYCWWMIVNEDEPNHSILRVNGCSPRNDTLKWKFIRDDSITDEVLMRFVIEQVSHDWLEDRCSVWMMADHMISNLSTLTREQANKLPGWSKAV